MNFKTALPAALALLRLACPSAAYALNDAMGIAQVYPTAANGKEWVNKWSNGVARTFTGVDPQDAWFDANHGAATYSVDGNGLFKITGATPRMYVHDPAKAVSWRNVEMTVYAMRVADDSTAFAGIVAVARSNHGTTGLETANLCDTRGYGGRMRLDGMVDFDKETSHPNATAAASKRLYAGGLPKNVWIGYKYVVYDLTDGNVKLEMWRDTTDGLNGGTWTKINEFTDNGANFGVGAAACQSGINPALRLTTSDARPGSESGKPNITVYWRSTNVGTNGLLYKKMTIREITPADAVAPDTTASNSTFTTTAAPPSVSACINSAGSWANAGLTPQSGTFTAAFDATPSMTRMDAVSGLSNGAASSYAALAAAVRFNNAGMIDARNGGGYASAAAIPYAAGLSYHFRLTVDILAHTYNAYVAQGASAEQLIASNYAFRTEQKAVTSLNNLGLLASTGSQADCGMAATATVAPPSVISAPPAQTPALTSGFYDNFSSYPMNTCYADGYNFGPWTSAYSGYGCVQTRTNGIFSWAEEAPKASSTPSETHASMILGPRFSGPIDYSLNIITAAQLRTGSAPNPWEVAWVTWNYADDTHFYYLALKPNGWELGKEDPAYPGAQRFLDSGSNPVYPIGNWYNVRIVQDAANSIKIYADDKLITSYTDTQRPYTSGRIGFYTEDAQVRVKDVAVNIAPPVAVSSPGVAANGVPALAPQKLLSPARADGINDAAVFGATASEVSVYDINGKAVFHSSQQPIVWNGRDGAGRVVESGVYIAKIRKSGAGVVYQSFVVAK